MRLGTFIEYKGFIGTIEYDSDDKIHYGSLDNIKDFVNYQADSVEQLYEEFHKSVDDYLELCKEIGKEPEFRR